MILINVCSRLAPKDPKKRIGYHHKVPIRELLVKNLGHKCYTIFNLLNSAITVSFINDQSIVKNHKQKIIMDQE